jgi:streptogramin lyase
MSMTLARPRRVIVVAVAVTSFLVAGCGQGPVSTRVASTGPGATDAAPSAVPTEGPSEPANASPSAATASPIAPTGLGDRSIATIDGVNKPCAMAATDTDVWVTGNNPSMLARIDPATNAIVSQTPTAGSACGIAVGPDGRLWIALLSAGQVIAVDPATGDVTDTIDGLGANLWDLKSGYGAIWVVDRTKRELLRIDPSAATVTGRVPIGRSASGLATVGGSVWVVDDADGSVRRIDPETLDVQATIELARGASWFADDGAALVVADRVHGSITPIDPGSTASGDPITGSSGPLDGTVLDGRAYIPDGTARTLVEVDLAAGSIDAVDSLDDAVQPFVAEIAFDDVWVLDYGGQRIWRIKP